MNLGSLIAYSVMPMIALNGAPPLILEDYGACQQVIHTEVG